MRLETIDLFLISCVSILWDRTGDLYVVLGHLQCANRSKPLPMKALYQITKPN